MLTEGGAPAALYLLARWQDSDLAWSKGIKVVEVSPVISRVGHAGRPGVEKVRERKKSVTESSKGIVGGG